MIEKRVDFEEQILTDSYCCCCCYCSGCKHHCRIVDTSHAHSVSEQQGWLDSDFPSVETAG